MPAFKQVDKPLDQLSIRHHRFAEYLVEGMTIKAAAIKAGFTAKQANSGATLFIRTTKEASLYPSLWDYYTKLRREKLRIFEATQKAVTEELKLIAFAKIDNYLDLPQRQVAEKVAKLQKDMADIAAELDKHIKERDPEVDEDPNGEDEVSFNEYGDPILPKRKKKATGYHAHIYHNTEEVQALKKKMGALREQLAKIKRGSGYVLRLKYLEDIPPELIPAIQEIRETREGIAVKLYSKIDALDMLAKLGHMYEQKDDDAKPMTIENFVIQVNGEKSDLLTDAIKRMEEQAKADASAKT